MSSSLILILAAAYFAVLFIISYITGRDNSNEAFFKANNKSPWFLVAFGMIGASLSGITFISVPGVVDINQFSYMQMVIGYMFGYAFIALVLMPIYYSLNLTSIYTYLEERFGFWSYKTGSAFFLISRIIGASLRLYLVAMVLHNFVFATWGIPFAGTVFISILLIWLYTFRGGIKTIVITDTFQTAFMLLSIGLMIWFLSTKLSTPISDLWSLIQTNDMGQVFFFEGGKKWWLQMLNGALIAIVMTGLDQDMMQKNLTCKDLPDAQKNMFSFSLILIVVNFIILCLGALLYIYIAQEGIAVPFEMVDGEKVLRRDLLFPEVALNHSNALIGGIFILGLLAAAYSSADSALTSLTTAFCVDFLGMDKDQENRNTRYAVHLGFSIILFIVIIIFRMYNDDSVIWEVFKAAGFTYGPLLGLFALGLFTDIRFKDHIAVLLVCIGAALLSFILNANSESWFGYKIGFEILAINAVLTMAGLILWRLAAGENVEDPR